MSLDATRGDLGLAPERTIVEKASQRIRQGLRVLLSNVMTAVDSMADDVGRP